MENILKFHLDMINIFSTVLISLRYIERLKAFEKIFPCVILRKIDILFSFVEIFENN